MPTNNFVPGALYQYQNEIRNRKWYFDLKRHRLTWYHDTVPNNIDSNILVLKGDTIMFLRRYEINLIYITFLCRNSILDLHATEENFSNAWVQLK